MEQKRRILICAGIVAAFVAAICGLELTKGSEPKFCGRPLSAWPEPSYQGKPLSAWLTNYYYFSLHADRPLPGWLAADDAISAMATNAYPALLRALQAHDPPWKSRLFDLLNKQHFIQIHHEPASKVSASAALALDRLTVNRIPFIDAAIHRRIQNPELLVPPLLEIYEHGPDENVQVCAAQLLSNLGPAAKPALPSLIRGLVMTNISGSPYRQIASISALGELKAESSVVVPLLLPLLGQTNRAMHEAAVKTMSQLSPVPQLAPQVVPALTKMLSDTNMNRSFLERYLPPLLANYGTNASPSLPVLFGLLQTPPREWHDLRATVKAIRKN